MSGQEPTKQSAAALTATVLAEEAAREDAQNVEILLGTDELVGVGGDEASLKEGLAQGGARLFYVLAALNALDELEAQGLAVLAPNIAEGLNVSDGTITFIAAAATAFFVLGAVPMGYLADRVKRVPIVGIASSLFAVFVFISGLAVNALMLFVTRFFVGISKSNTIPVHTSLLADAYPVNVRARVFAANAALNRFANAISPVLVGAIAAAAGGPDDWRWPFFILSIPIGIFAFMAFTLKEPSRGQWEQTDVLGEFAVDEAPPLISVENAFARLWQIKTMRTIIIAFTASTFGLIPLAPIRSFFLEEEFGLGTFNRGLAIAAMEIGAVLFIPIFGKKMDAQFRKDPTGTMRLVGLAMAPVAILLPLQFLMPSVALFILFGIPNSILLGTVFAMTQPITQSIVPYRLRGLGTALATMMIFLFGGVLGSLLSGFLQDAYSERAAVIIISVPSMTIGAFMMLRASSLLHHDMSLNVAEIREEDADRKHRLANPDDIPAIQVNELDFSYGRVQVLFDLSFEVRTGETLALLGTNGAGKSTILRVITGLGTPSRGVIRLHGRNITYGSPEQRAAEGIQMLPGGKGTFTEMSIHDNLLMGAFRYRNDEPDMNRRIERVYELFPSLSERRDYKAGDLSGGQQQMLALARVMLHDPDVLIIDELSLGLAPTVVQELLMMIEGLKAAGQTMIIVEQSLNVALAVADRAVFLEKGQVRFEGPASELAERDDLARAVFLGTEGG